MCSHALVHALDLGKADARIEDLLLDLRSGEVSSGVGADICQSVPLVHAEFSNAHLDVETAVDVLTDVPLSKNVSQHLLVNILATLDLRDKSSPRLGKCTQRVAKEILPPFMLSVIRS
jgi:hypothetical protein